ncbi:hypothetical protein [Streptomyces sp. NPDC058335]|uniref:hypothetical protein n=1 Tax=Streptomyces sp. NPDC058335 TaxID=3346451 RepID=UPI00364C4303
MTQRETDGTNHPAGRASRAARRAIGSLALAAAMTFGSLLFATVLLLTAVGTPAVVGAWLRPQTVLPLRRIAGAKRRQAVRPDRPGRAILEAYEPLTGPLRQRLRTAVRDPGTLACVPSCSSRSMRRNSALWAAIASRPRLGEGTHACRQPGFRGGPEQCGRPPRLQVRDRTISDSTRELRRSSPHPTASTPARAATTTAGRG